MHGLQAPAPPQQSRQLASLRRWARRHALSDAEAEDLLQDALLVTFESGHWCAGGTHAAFTAGVVRMVARQHARTEGRRRHREQVYAETQTISSGASAQAPDATPWTGGLLLEEVGNLPPSLRTLAQLVLGGHNRQEAAWLLDLTDTALRQRITALKRRLGPMGLVPPDEPPALRRPLAYGRIRRDLLPVVTHLPVPHVGLHDPDGHLLLVRLPGAGRGGLLTKRLGAATGDEAAGTTPPPTGA